MINLAIKTQLPAEQSVALSELSESNKKIVLAKISEPPYNQKTPEQQAVFAGAIISMGYIQYQSSGKPDSKEIKTQTEMLLDVLSGPFGRFTMSEIKLAFKKGLVELAYGECYGMCARTYHQILKGYENSRERISALAEFQKKLDALTIKEKTTEEKMVASKTAIVSIFEAYKKSGDIGLMPHITYDLICELKGVKTLVDQETRSKIIEQTKEEKTKQDAIEKDTDKYSPTIKKYAVAAMSGAVAKGLAKNVILNRQKEKALIHYFDALIGENKPLEL